MPMLLLLFAVIIDGGRMMWSYQTAVAGVRDATRYLARVAPVDICTTGGSVAGYTATLTGIVQNSIYGNQLFPNGIAVNSVVPSLTCIAGTYRVSPVPIAQVTANLSITFFFSGIFNFAGQSQAAITTTVTDQSRIYGL